MRATSSSPGQRERTAEAYPYPSACSCRRPPRALRPSDVARAHPAQDFARGLDRRHVSTGWPIPELFSELVGDPARLIAPLLRNVREHSVPSIFLDLVIVDDGSPALDEPKLASGGRNEL